MDAEDRKMIVGAIVLGAVALYTAAILGLAFSVFKALGGM